jgi:hypothetical protein
MSRFSVVNIFFVFPYFPAIAPIAEKYRNTMKIADLAKQFDYLIKNISIYFISYLCWLFQITCIVYARSCSLYNRTCWLWYALITASYESSSIHDYFGTSSFLGQIKQVAAVTNWINNLPKFGRYFLTLHLWLCETEISLYGKYNPSNMRCVLKTKMYHRKVKKFEERDFNMILENHKAK